MMPNILRPYFPQLFRLNKAIYDNDNGQGIKYNQRDDEYDSIMCIDE